MKIFNKVLVVLSVFLIFSAFNNARAEDSLESLTKEINDLREEISQLTSSADKEAIKIDKALEQLDELVEFVNTSVEKGRKNMPKSFKY